MTRYLCLLGRRSCSKTCACAVTTVTQTCQAPRLAPTAGAQLAPAPLSLVADVSSSIIAVAGDEAVLSASSIIVTSRCALRTLSGRWPSRLSSIRFPIQRSACRLRLDISPDISPACARASTPQPLHHGCLERKSPRSRQSGLLLLLTRPLYRFSASWAT